MAQNRGTTHDGNSRGSLVDYESTKIKRTTLSTTVAELYAILKTFGTCHMIKGLWMDLSGEEGSYAH